MLYRNVETFSPGSRYIVRKILLDRHGSRVKELLPQYEVVNESDMAHAELTFAVSRVLVHVFSK